MTEAITGSPSCHHCCTPAHLLAEGPFQVIGLQVALSKVFLVLRSKIRKVIKSKSSTWSQTLANFPKWKCMHLLRKGIQCDTSALHYHNSQWARSGVIRCSIRLSPVFTYDPGTVSRHISPKRNLSPWTFQGRGHKRAPGQWTALVFRP